MLKTHAPLLVCALLLAGGITVAAQEQSTQPNPANQWPSTPPPDIPFQPSRELTGIVFTGRHAEYEHADTWFPSWASDGKMYSPWTDGTVNGISSSSLGPHATTGYATILGSDPLHLTIADVGTYQASPEPYGGRYPAGTLVYNGIWYYGTYCLNQTPNSGLNWDILGPFVGFRWSTDYGRTWHPSPHTPANPLFGGSPIWLGLPHFVDFGKNMQYSPDGKAYIVSQGAADPDPHPRIANLSWITGDQIDLARVVPGIDTINRRSAYEFFAGRDAHGHALWTRDYSRIRPLFDWNNHTGNVSVTWDAPLKKYLMAITDGGNTVGKFSTYVLESSQIAGPWRLVAYLRDFGEQAYFVNFPSRFISKDGRTLWMSYSANFVPHKSNPPGSGYWWTLQEIHLLGPNGR